MPPKGVKRKAKDDKVESSKKPNQTKTQAASKSKATNGKATNGKANKEQPKKLDMADAPKAIERLLASLKNEDWKEALADEIQKPYFGEVAVFVEAERQAHVVHPPVDLVFSAFNETPLSQVRVVIIGQDPYHEPGQAHGMCFSVLPGVKPPPSLKNIYKELETDIPGFKAPDHGHLVKWAQQGILLLNATLTVREGHKEANSHAQCGWQKFTDGVIEIINKRCEGVVFLLWGGFAQKKGKIVDTTRHRVIETGHPSPLSVKKWRDCKVFSKCNEELKRLGKGEITWSLD